MITNEPVFTCKNCGCHEYKIKYSNVNGITVICKKCDTVYIPSKEKK